MTLSNVFSHPALRLLLAGLLSLSLISCSVGGRPKVNTQMQSVTLPSAPAYLQPVQVKTPVVGEDPLLVALRYRQGLNQCNARITAGATDWTAMQGFYATP